jgi:hypothetical protein
MIDYEIRYENSLGEYKTAIMTACDSARAVIAWRRAMPDCKMLWMKRKDGVPGSTMDERPFHDRRLPPEPD